MRIFSALAALVVPLATVAAAPVRQPTAPPAASPTATRCAPPRATFAGTAPSATGARKLADQPPANHYLAVSRQVGNCPEPAIVRTGVGG